MERIQGWRRSVILKLVAFSSILVACWIFISSNEGTTRLFSASASYKAPLESSYTCANGFIIHDHCQVEYLKRVVNTSGRAGLNVERVLCRTQRSQASSVNVVFGLGQGTTGTHAVSYALQFLGLRVFHFAELYEQGHPERRLAAQVVPNARRGLQELRNALYQPPETCHDMLDRFNFSVLVADTNPSVDAFFDFPLNELALEFLNFFPESRFLISTRSAEGWVSARLRDHGESAQAPYLRPCGHPLRELPREAAVSLFNAHHTFLECTLMDRLPSNRQLYVDLWASNLSSRDSWIQLGDLVQHRNSFIEDHCRFPREQRLLCDRETNMN